jgi:hypothetical protein
LPKRTFETLAVWNCGLLRHFVPLQDKTFGMKNKKGGAAKKKIALLTSGLNAAQLEKQKMRQALKDKKKKELEEAKMLGLGYAKVDSSRDKAKKRGVCSMFLVFSQAARIFCSHLL